MSDKKDVLATMRSRLQVGISAYSESRESELDDLRFASASPDNQWQWPQEVLATRTASNGQTINARPCLTINKLPQHIRQITNDMRQNRPAGKVIPVDDKADIKVAEVFDGMVRHIEYISDADVADDTACENQVTFGEGYFRLLTEYCDDDSFDQDIRIGRIRNSFSVYMDPTMQDPCGEDAEWCFICEDITKDEYERLYPDATPVSTLQAQGTGDQSFSAWLDEETIRIAEYFYVEYVKTSLNLYADGSTLYADDPKAKQHTDQPIKSRPVDRRAIKWMKTNGADILEEREWPGKWIPVIRVVGNEVQVEGRLYVSGIVRNAKDAQRMYNYWVSQEAEMLALAPKAPFIGYGGQFEGYEDKWARANIDNVPYLEVNEDATDQEGRPLPLPQRAMPPMASSGLLQAKMGASDDIKSTTGQYDASLGAEANEKSGKAILARERQTDTGTFHYVDNYARAVRYRTRQIVDLIPKVYDTRRIARIIGLDGETSHVTLDPEAPQAVTKVVDETGAVIEKIYNPSVGKYDVCVTTGPSYMTKRQENASMMVELAQGASDPVVALVMRYFAVKNMDFPDAQEFAAVLKKMVPDNLLETDSEEEAPELAAMRQQLQQAQQQVEMVAQQASQQLEQKDMEIMQERAARMKAEIDAKKSGAMLQLKSAEDAAMTNVRNAEGEVIEKARAEREIVMADGTPWMDVLGPVLATVQDTVNRSTEVMAVIAAGQQQTQEALQTLIALEATEEAREPKQTVIQIQKNPDGSFTGIKTES